MSATIKDYPVPSSVRAREAARTSWRELKWRWTLRCPQCGQTWLVIGARAGAAHTCKACHHSFIIEARR